MSPVFSSFPSSSPPAFFYFFPFSNSLSFSPSLSADERQALSRQWHSKTSGLGSTVSGYSTLLGAISLSKAWPACSPTENHHISYYTPRTEGRHKAALWVRQVCLREQNKMETNRDSRISVCLWARGKVSEKALVCWYEGEWESGCMCAWNLWAAGHTLAWLHLPKVSTQQSQVHSQTPNPSHQ